LDNYRHFNLTVADWVASEYRWGFDPLAVSNCNNSVYLGLAGRAAASLTGLGLGLTLVYI